MRIQGLINGYNILQEYSLLFMIKMCNLHWETLEGWMHLYPLASLELYCKQSVPV